MSQMSIPSNLNDPDKHFITRGELENDLNALREEIQTLKQRIFQQELEQKLTYFQWIKKILLLYNLYLSVITIYQTFKLEYTELIIQSEVEIDKPNILELPIKKNYKVIIFFYP